MKEHRNHIRSPCSQHDASLPGHSHNKIVNQLLLTSQVKFQQCCHIKTNSTRTFSGWLIVLHRSSTPVTASTLICIFSLLDILFPAGLTKSGKVNGTFKENWPLEYTIFWDHRTLIDKLEPPSTYHKPVRIQSKSVPQQENSTKLFKKSKATY